MFTIAAGVVLGGLALVFLLGTEAGRILLVVVIGCLMIGVMLAIAGVIALLVSSS